MTRLHSSMPLDDCLRELAARIDSPWEVFGGKSVIGSLRGHKLLVRKRPPPFVRNAFQVHMSATLRPEAGGTAITCKFTLHPFILAFIALWITGVLFAVGAGVVSAITELLNGGHLKNVSGGILAPLGLLVAAAVVVGIGYLLSEADEEFLIRFIKTSLRAEPGGLPDLHPKRTDPRSA